MTRRQTIGENPLDDMISRQIERNSNSITTVERDQSDTQKKEKLAKKQRITVQIPEEIIDRVKNAVYEERITLAQFMEEALEETLKRLEKQRGAPYPKRRAELKPGRPLK